MNDSFRSGFIAMIGRPNAGKSTLLNRLIGRKIAITSDKPQTTRNKIAGVLTSDDWQMVFLDTPGVHKPLDRLGEEMVRTALNTLNEVDVIYLLVDASIPFGGGDEYLAEKLKKIETPVFLLLNKIDKIKKADLLPLIDLYRTKGNWQEIFPISALKGENTDGLLEATLQLLPAGPSYYPTDAATDQPERQLVAELIREKVIAATRDEVPHAVAVEIEHIEKRNDRLLYIAAVIYTERDSQKGIIIGKKGDMLKQIGSQARHDIEVLLGSKIYLELRVKVKADWRSTERALCELGYKYE